MTDSLRVNQEPLLLYEVRKEKVAEGFKDNRLSLEDWNRNNQSVALLTPLANASQYLEGKNYTTSCHPIHVRMHRVVASQCGSAAAVGR